MSGPLPLLTPDELAAALTALDGWSVTDGKLHKDFRAWFRSGQAEGATRLTMLGGIGLLEKVAEPVG